MIRLTDDEVALAAAEARHRNNIRAPLGPEDYPAQRAANNYLALMSHAGSDPGQGWLYHGYQLGGTNPCSPPAGTSPGAPMADEVWDRKIARLAAAHRNVYAIPVRDGVVRQNVCLHFAADNADRGAGADGDCDR